MRRGEGRGQVGRTHFELEVQDGRHLKCSITGEGMGGEGGEGGKGRRSGGAAEGSLYAMFC